MVSHILKHRKPNKGLDKSKLRANPRNLTTDQRIPERKAGKWARIEWTMGMDYGCFGGKYGVITPKEEISYL